MEGESGSSAPPPAALIVEQQISGAILGSTLKSPSALAVNDRGSLYLIDAGNRRIVWFDAHLTAVRDFTGAGGSSGRLSEPAYLAVDPDRYLWISDPGRRLLTQCSERLEYIADIQPRHDDTVLETFDPSGVAVTGFGEVWVGDRINNRILVLDPVGEINSYVGDFAYSGGSLRQPTKLLADKRDQIYVCDNGNRRVVVYDDRGGVVREIEHSIMEDPVAVALDRYGRLWVLDRSSSKIHCFDRKEAYLASLGPIVSGTDRSLSHPSDLAFTLDGRLIISDTGNDRLLICQILSGT